MSETTTARLEGIEEKTTSTGKAFNVLTIEGDSFSCWSKGMLAGLEVGKTYEFPVTYGEFNRLVGRPRPVGESIQTTVVAVPKPIVDVDAEHAKHLKQWGWEETQLRARQVVALERIAAALRIYANGNGADGCPSDGPAWKHFMSVWGVFEREPSQEKPDVGEVER